MDGFELNKIAGAVLAAMLVMAGGKTALDIVLQKHKSEKSGWELPVTIAKPEGAKAPAPFDVAAVLASLPKANPDNGAEVFRKCLQCHTPNKGERHLVGPNLWGIVGRKVAQVSGFEARYSDALKKHAGEWTWEQLAKYLHAPAEAIPGNKMLFPGVKDSSDLADLLVYMRKLADNPVPLAR